MLSWRRLLSAYCVIYLSFWAFFALLYLPMAAGTSCADATKVRTYYDAFMLSLNVASTIGFGNVQVNESCSFYPVIILMVQILTSLTIDCIFMGIIFAKLARPQKRKVSLMFSECAVINDGVEGGFAQLQVRLADARRSHLVECHTRFVLYEEFEGPDGFDIRQTDLESDGAEWTFTAIPILITHTITEDSPLARLMRSPGACFEVVCVVEGIVPTTGMTTQATESYHHTEVRHGHRFLPMVRKASRPGRPPIEIDFNALSATSRNA